MAGPSVMVKILGDVTGLGNSFNEAGAKGQSAANKMHSAFSGMLNTLNSSGVLGPFGNALQTADQSIQSMGEHAKGTSTKMIGLGGAALGVGAALSAMGSKDQAAHQQLQASVAATGHSYDQYGTKVEDAIKHEEHFGNSAGETQDALSKLTQATHDPTQALELLTTATNVAAAKHEDLTTAATQVGKVYNGNTKLLKEYGIVLDKHTKLTADGKTATQALAAVTAGQATAAVNTFNGKMKALQTTLTDHIALFGQKYGPALQKAGLAMAGLGSAIKVTQGFVELLRSTQVIQTAVQYGLTAATWAWNVALDANPVMLVVLAIAALIAIVVLVTSHFVNWKAVIVDIWDWIKANWPLLLGIITGPIGLAVYLITKYWSDFKEFFTTAANGIKDVASHIWDGLESAAKSVFNAVARAWNDTVGQLNFTVPSWIPGLGGHSFGVPKIPTSYETGGYVPTTGLALLHAGETVVPATQSAAPGPAVVIQHAHFSSELDVDTFMRRAAWVAKTRRP
jgi:hypothetical protein